MKVIWCSKQQCPKIGGFKKPHKYNHIYGSFPLHSNAQETERHTAEAIGECLDNQFSRRTPQHVHFSDNPQAKSLSSQFSKNLTRAFVPEYKRKQQIPVL